MAGWTTINQELIPGGGLNLLQNCDLPPPLKVFGRADEAVLSFTNRIWTITGQEDRNQDHLQMCTSDPYENNEKLELLKALRLSQTRAREADRKAARLTKERLAISNAVLLGCLSFKCLSYKGNSNMAQVMVRVQGMCHGSWL